MVVDDDTCVRGRKALEKLYKRTRAPKPRKEIPQESAAPVLVRAQRNARALAVVARNGHANMSAASTARQEDARKHARAVNSLNNAHSALLEVQAALLDLRSGTARDPGELVIPIRSVIGRGTNSWALIRSHHLSKAVLTTRKLAGMAERFAAEQRKPGSPGKPDDEAFILELARYWHWLVGRRPGKRKDQSRTPFSEFVTEIMGREGENLSHLINSALATLESMSAGRQAPEIYQAPWDEGEFGGERFSGFPPHEV